MTTTFGWDASDFDWQRGSMDLSAAARAGISFFTHKATEGTSVQHVHYGAALTRARAAGIPVLGAYHVVRTGNVAAELAWHFAVLDRETPWWRTWPDWLLQVDLEKWPYDSVSAATGEAFAQVAAQAGCAVVVYASKSQYGDQLAGLQAPLWNAAYPSANPGDFRGLYTRSGGDGGAGWQAYSGRAPLLWQYTSVATIGTQPGCDANAFRGTLDQLKAVLRGGRTAIDMELTDAVPGTQTPDYKQDRTVEQVLADDYQRTLATANAVATLTTSLNSALSMLSTLTSDVAALKATVAASEGASAPAAPTGGTLNVTGQLTLGT